MSAMGEKLVWAIKNGDFESVKNMTEHAEFEVDAELLNGRSALHYAADYGQHDVAELLLKKGANINLPDKYGITPLLSAIFESHEDVVKLLVGLGAEKDGKTPSGDDYIDVAETPEIKAYLMV